MQSQKALLTSVVIFIFLHCLTLQVSSIDTLKQGQTLNSTSELLSSNGAFSLRFHTPQNSNNTYLALWFTGTSRASFPVWIANRQNPIPTNSNPTLTLTTAGDLTITHDGAVTPLVLFSGTSSSSAANLTATLLNTGNFILDSNSPAGVLWQSFNTPSDTLLSGMKLGRNLTLTSWAAADNPAPGEYSLEWDSTSRNLLMRRGTAVIWRSGELEYYRDESGESRAEFENMDDLGRDEFNFNFNFTTQEDYVLFSVLPYPGSPQQVLSGWRLENDGDIVDINTSRFIAQPVTAPVAGAEPPRGNAAPPPEGLRAWVGFVLVAAVYVFA